MESQTFAISGCERPTTVQDILCRIVQLISSAIGIIVQPNVRYSPKRHVTQEYDKCIRYQGQISLRNFLKF